jgi:hypothetical protein
MESQTQKQRPKRLEICGIKSLEYLLFWDPRPLYWQQLPIEFCQ